MNDLKEKEKQLGLKLNWEKEESDMIHYYCLRSGAAIDKFLVPETRPSLSETNLSNIKEKLEFPNISIADTLKTPIDFGLKLDLGSQAPRSYHIEFNTQSDLLNMNRPDADYKKHIQVLEGSLPKKILLQLKDTLDQLEESKYRALTDFIQGGGIFRNFSVDLFFDGEKMLKTSNPFAKSTGFINGINFSANLALKTTYFDTKSFEPSVKKEVDKRNINLRKDFTCIKGTSDLLMAIKEGETSFQ